MALSSYASIVAPGPSYLPILCSTAKCSSSGLAALLLLHPLQTRSRLARSQLRM